MPPDTLLFSRDQLTAFTSHPSDEVRAWAMRHLANHHTYDSVPLALDRLGDPERQVSLAARDLLLAAADPVCVPALTALIPEASEATLSDVASVLAALDAREAAALLRERLNALSTIGFSGLEVIRVAGRLGDDALRADLRDWFGAPGQEPDLKNAIIAAVLAGQRPADLAWAAALPRWSTPLGWQPARAIANSLDVSQAWRTHGDSDLDLRQLLEWLDASPCCFSDGFLDDISLARGTDRWLERLRAEARHLVDVAAVTSWGGRLEGYRWHAAGTLALVDCELPDHLRGVALAAVISLAGQRDDHAHLDAADDRDAALLEILGQPRQRVLPGVVRSVAALGTSAVEPLVAILEDRDRYWARMRAAEALEHIARRDAECCASAVPALLAAMDPEEGDFLFESAMQTLAVIGPPAIDPIRRALCEIDDYGGNGLCSVLGDIPAAGSFDALAEHLERTGYADEFIVAGLEESADPRAIPLLEEWWAPDAPGAILIARALLLLTDLHQPDHPGRADWQRHVDRAALQQRVRLAELSRPIRRSASPAPVAKDVKALRAKRKAKRQRRKEQRRRAKKRRGKKRR